jgi:hypothetical protein
MDSFRKRSMEGHYGKPLQLASMLGEKIANTPEVDEAITYWADKGFKKGMSEFYDSLVWWVSH